MIGIISVLLLHSCLCSCHHLLMTSGGVFRNVPLTRAVTFGGNTPINYNQPRDTDLSFPGRQKNNQIPPVSNFRSEINEPPPIPSVRSDVIGNCSIEQGTITFNNKCHLIFSLGPCPFGYWVILDNNGSPECTGRPCPEGQIMYNKNCVNTDDSSMCGLNQILYIEFTGVTSCDCEPASVYDARRKICVFEHTQDFCPAGQYIESDVNGNISCVNNPCRSDKEILNPDNGRCYAKYFIGRCLGHLEKIAFSENTNSAECTKIDTRRILEVPSSSACPEGSKRDHLNNCKEIVKIQPRNPFNFRIPSRLSRSSTLECKEGYRRYPNGTCQKRNTFLGR